LFVKTNVFKIIFLTLKNDIKILKELYTINKNPNDIMPKANGKKIVYLSNGSKAANICRHTDCEKFAVYGLKNADNIFVRHVCAKHKTVEMIAPYKTCDECTKIPGFGYINGEAIKCKKHIMEGMIDIKNAKNKCKNPQCTKQPYFGNPNDYSASYCKAHKLEGMVDIRSIKCVEPKCTKQPFFGYPDSIPTYCKTHKLDGMEDIKSKKCKEHNCKKRCSFGYPNDKISSYCADHKLDGMENIVSKRCIEPNCTSVSTFGYPNDDCGSYCKKHKLDGMEYINKTKCLTEGCTISVPSIKYNHYKGYCFRCFTFIFPEVVTKRNCKTKEYHIQNLIASTDFGIPKESIIFDRVIDRLCGSRRRPDIFIDLQLFTLIIEIDENQHKSYNTSCENAKVVSEYIDTGMRPIVILRFNPDSYIAADGDRIKSCFNKGKDGLYMIDDEVDWKRRTDAIINFIKEHIDLAKDNRVPPKEINISRLCYDGQSKIKN
jgi:hypothetical protein